MTTLSTRPTTRKRVKLATARTQKRAITPEDLLNFQLLGDPQVSPDGSTVLFTHKRVGEKNEYATNLWLVSTTGKGRPRPFTSGNRDSHPRWSPDGSRIAFISSREKPKPQIYIINAAGGEARKLTDFPEGSLPTFTWSPDGRMLAVKFRDADPLWTKDAKKQREEKGLSDPPRVLDDWWYRLDGDGYFNAQRHHLYLVDVETGKHRKVYDKDTLGDFGFDFSPDSKRLVLATNRHPKAMIRAWKEELLILNIASGKLTPIRGLPEGPKSDPRWSPDGRLIAYAGRIGKDHTYSTENLELWVCDPAGAGARSLTSGEDYCLLAVCISDTAEVGFGPNFQWASDSKRLFAQIGWHGESHIASIPVANRSSNHRRMTFHTRGRVIHNMGNLSADGRVMAMTAGSATSLEEIHVAQTDGNSFKPRPLTDLNRPLLDELDLAPIEEHWLTSADGTRVHTWVMKPRSASNGRHPAVLEIHGGPHAQYGVGFFHEFQVLAAQGYIVFFSNPRGSKGYGRDHCAAIRGNWGTADWTDIQAVIDFMRSRRDVDSSRMGVMGGSYGGYMTNWVIGHTNAFAGAITDRCVSNLVSMFGTSDYVDEPDRYWPGNSWDRPEHLWKCSPMKHLGHAKTPTLIIHSEGDLRCNVEQAEQVFTVLKLNTVPTRFVRYPSSTSHGFSRCGPPDMRLHRLGQILDWWKRYLSPPKRQAGAKRRTAKRA
jgi:dipeptidyl aminopeptidase/acylaminoacyl peptidase